MWKCQLFYLGALTLPFALGEKKNTKSGQGSEHYGGGTPAEVKTENLRTSVSSASSAVQ